MSAESMSVKQGTPEWIGDVLTIAQRDLNPSLRWLKVLQSERVKLEPAAKEIGAILYGIVGANGAGNKTGGPYWIGQELIAEKANRSPKYTRKALKILATVGMAIVEDPGSGRRQGYVLSLPNERPTWVQETPRRSGTVQEALRRPSDEEPDTPAQETHPPVPVGLGTPVQETPRRPVEELSKEPSAPGREGGEGEPSRQTLLAFAKTELPLLDDPDEFEAWVQGEVDGSPQKWRDRYRLANMEPADMFYELVAPKVVMHRAKFESEWQQGGRAQIAKILARGELTVGAAARIVGDSDLSGAKKVVGLMAHKLSEAEGSRRSQHAKLVRQDYEEVAL